MELEQKIIQVFCIVTLTSKLQIPSISKEHASFIFSG